MTDLEAIEHRHSVRAYQEKEIESKKLDQLEELANQYNRIAGLHIQLVRNEPKAFQSRLAKYGKFENVKYYFIIAGKKSPDLEEKCGYYGEKLVLEAQKLGLNSCWVGLTYKKIPGAFSLEPDEKIVCAIALGYGKTNGIFHKSKDASALSNIHEAPLWFKQGVQAALLAPTAVNQQAFQFHYDRSDGKVKATTKSRPYGKVDLGIAKAHFEIGANQDQSIWK